MRRALIAITLSSALVGLAGCASDSPKTAPSSAAPTSASPSPSAVDYTADTKKICDDLDKTLDQAFKEFGTELGKMIAYKQAGNTAEAAKAKKAAQKEATELATMVRTKTEAAQDPEFQQAGVEAADNIAASAKDEAFFAKMKTVKDLDKLESEISGWVVPIAAYCG